MTLENSPNFSIAAKTCTLKYNSQKNGETIFGSNSKYVIPIYQRPYSWTEGQIKKFISDMFISYWGSESIVSEEPMFIGTIQLSNKNEKNEQDIIDGQQRLTTFLVLLKVLKYRFSDSAELNSISFDWLSTRVNSGKQQKYLEEIINEELPATSSGTLNPYLNNARLINEAIDEQLIDGSGNPIAFDYGRFILHLLSNVYFVVIETRAGLSKTLQIFNAINTTGLDLNGGDIFKIRMYEYLKDKKGMDETAFDEISRLYKKIDDNNAQINYKAIDINGVLGIYQYILIGRYNLPVTLYSYATDTFFERLFDTIFKITQWEHFKNNVNTLDLSLGDIERIIDVRYEWENTDYLTAEDGCAMNFIHSSRYSRYWILTFIFLYKFKEQDNYWSKMLLFTKQLSKLYMMCSIRFLRAVNEVHTFTYSLIKVIMTKSFEDVMAAINKKIGRLENHKGWGDLENTLLGDITYNAKKKNIICKLSAMLEEEYKTPDIEKIKLINNKLFESAIDIEHIQPYHDKNGEKRMDIWTEWKENINSIGNLMVLEQAINRSISNDLYQKKFKAILIVPLLSLKVKLKIT